MAEGVTRIRRGFALKDLFTTAVFAILVVAGCNGTINTEMSLIHRNSTRLTHKNLRRVVEIRGPV